MKNAQGVELPAPDGVEVEPMIVSASVSAVATGSLEPGQIVRAGQIEAAMVKATEEALAAGITDPDEIKALKSAAFKAVVNGEIFSAGG